METEENIGGACIFSPAASTSRITTRSEWYSCIFCKNKTYKKDAKLHKVESEDRIKNILEAARINSDHEIESTVLHENFTENALYHSACITKYLLKTPQKVKAESSDHDTAFVKLVSEINSDLMVKHKAFMMSNLLEKFRFLLPQDYADKYTTYKLQNSSSISIGDAIKAASQLKSELKIAQLDLEIGSSKNTTSEEQILHTAANILRRDIHSLDLNNDYYPTPSECSLPLSIQSMPPNLTKFISCIGKLWADGGLRDLMVDSGVYAGCTVDQMLLGKQFNRSVRGLTLVYEALRSLWFASFFKWCEENDGDALEGTVTVRLQITCETPVEYSFYASTLGRQNICAHCGASGAQKDQDLCKSCTSSLCRLYSNEKRHTKKKPH
ncbi:Hypothetical predicted protein [Mytilus galloprovincialis]|uniref:Uncharacterized protein n=1 Tax=Mytilus galloprovincialis TaxID=29158 RepID=A0A8B6FB19_MYTGA|nr:Hypothetical predicted protein [Mytilus galloprovincialis]